MGLKPDHWIRTMALEHRMIEPYAPNQVRPISALPTSLKFLLMSILR